MRKKRKVKTSAQKAFNECEKSMIAMVNRRDRVCQICASTSVLQAHHAIISRKHKSTFFEDRQMLLICSSCHTKATFKTHGIDIACAVKIAEREGQTYIDWLFIESRNVKKWSVQELEELKRRFDTSYACNQ